MEDVYKERYAEQLCFDFTDIPVEQEGTYWAVIDATGMAGGEDVHLVTTGLHYSDLYYRGKTLVRDSTDEPWEELSEQLDVWCGCGTGKTKRDIYGYCIQDDGNGCHG